MAGKSGMMMIVMLIAVACMMVSSSMALIGGAAMSFPSIFTGGMGVTSSTGPLDVTFDNIKRASDGCIVLYEHGDGSGTNHEFCLDGRGEYKVNNLKNYNFNDKASTMDVGGGVEVKVYDHADFKGRMFRTSSPGWVNLGDKFKHNIMSSLQLNKN